MVPCPPIRPNADGVFFCYSVWEIYQDACGLSRSRADSARGWIGPASMTPHPLPWALGWSNMRNSEMFSVAFRSFRSVLKKRQGRYQTLQADDEKCTVSRKDLETIFAYELRVANADILKMKVYGKTERFKSGRIIPVGPEHQSPRSSATFRKTRTS